jgi:hypothetical protein
MIDVPSSTLFLRLLTRLVGADHPIRLGCGVSLGILLKLLLDGMAATFPDTAFIVRIADNQMIWFILACIPVVYWPLISGRRGAPEPVVHTINTIQAVLDRAKLTKVQEAMFWRALLDKYVAAAQPDLSVQM